MSYPEFSKDYKTEEVLRYISRLRIAGVTSTISIYVSDEFNMSVGLANKYVNFWNNNKSVNNLLSFEG